MLDKFQSVAAMTRQIADGYEYYLVMREGGSVGYFALVPNVAERDVMLSKIYVRQAQRGGGIGKAILGFVEGRCLELGLKEVWLTVNRNNAGSIAFYRKRGFVEAGSIVQDIGNGYVMDDYKMVKVVGAGRGRKRP
jgi:L-amino acid N-acyltransferase YncA